MNYSNREDRLFAEMARDRAQARKYLTRLIAKRRRFQIAAWVFICPMIAGWVLKTPVLAFAGFLLWLMAAGIATISDYQAKALILHVESQQGDITPGKPDARDEQ